MESIISIMRLKLYKLLTNGLSLKGKEKLIKGYEL